MTRLNRDSGHTLERFERLMKKTYSKLYNHACRLVKNPSDAEDLTQETYYRALRAFDTYDESKSFENWVRKILGRLFLDFIRYRKRRVKTVSYDAPLPQDHSENVYFEKPDERTNPETQLMRRELEYDLESALKDLTPGQRAIVLMADVEEIPYHEIAESVGAPIGTIRSHLHRTHKMLQKKLSKSRAA